MVRTFFSIAVCWLLVSTTLAQGPAGDSAASTPVLRQTLEEHIQLDGVIEAVQQSTVSAQTSGTVEALPFDVDDSVAAGDLIVQLEDSEQQARLRQAEAAQDEARAGLADAQQTFDRIAAIRERGLVSRQEFDQARNNLNAAEARMARANGMVAEARQRLDYTRVVAPYSGILTERHVELGESVSPGQPLLSGLSLENLRVVVDLPQRYAELARKERSAQVTLPDGRVLHTGEITFYPYANPTTHTFRLRMSLAEPDGSLYPGMLVKVAVPVAHRTALWVPASSIIHRSELRAVYVVDEAGRARLRPIRTGLRDGDRVEVLAGLEEGEQVVIQPVEALGSKELAPDPEARP